MTTKTSTDAQTNTLQREYESTTDIISSDSNKQYNNSSNLDQDLEKNLDDATKLIE